MRSCSNIVGIYMISWCNISEKKRTLTVPRSQNRGLWECAFCTPLYTFSVLTYALTGKKKNKWQDSTLCILPLGHEKTQLSASFPWGLKKPKKTKKKKTKDMPPMPTVSRNLCFFCFFCFFSSFGFFGSFVVFFCFLFIWTFVAYLGLLWPFDDVKTLQEENTAKHCKENSAKRTGAQRPFLRGGRPTPV